MNNSLIFIFLLLMGISCSEPKSHSEIDDIYQSLSDQKHFYYNVKYSINKPHEKSTSSLHGLVSLNRNADSGISAAYFGLQPMQRPNYINSIYLQQNWIHELSSNIFNIERADVLSDSLHSPILLNPNILFKIEADSVKVTKNRISESKVKWTFHLNHKPNQLLVTWDEKLDTLTELECRYNVNSENAYSRKWEFDYISKQGFNRLADTYKNQNQITDQPFL